jgi:hypothetical protein
MGYFGVHGLVWTFARISSTLNIRAKAAFMESAAEIYTPERKAEFLLSNATNRADYRRARKEVRKLGLDPDSIPHCRPVSIRVNQSNHRDQW